ncbi:MAG: twin transmembrane helix small protein [Sphingomonas sp.]|nr:twin transmembrane helix small protein [Sphingomonas sp.]RZV51852.1 MAG: twin transmembrane helix small protein [Sphingomonadaceae bacterium]
MTWFLAILLIVAMAATAYVLIRGVIAMASGKEVDQQRQQDYMRKRVFFQGIAIVIIVLLLILAGQAA